METVAEVFFSWVSLRKLRLRLRIVYREVVVVCRVNTEDEAGIRNRYVAETQTDKR